MTLNQYSLEALVVRIQIEFLERPTLCCPRQCSVAHWTEPSRKAR